MVIADDFIDVVQNGRVQEQTEMMIGCFSFGNDGTHAPEEANTITCAADVDRAISRADPAAPQIQFLVDIGTEFDTQKICDIVIRIREIRKTRRNIYYGVSMRLKQTGKTGLLLENAVGIAHGQLANIL